MIYSNKRTLRNIRKVMRQSSSKMNHNRGIKLCSNSCRRMHDVLRHGRGWAYVGKERFVSTQKRAWNTCGNLNNNTLKWRENKNMWLKILGISRDVKLMRILPEVLRKKFRSAARVLSVPSLQLLENQPSRTRTRTGFCSEQGLKLFGFMPVHSFGVLKIKSKKWFVFLYMRTCRA